MSQVHILDFEQIDYHAEGENIFGVLPVDSMPEAGAVVSLGLFNYTSAAMPLPERINIMSNRKLCPVWTVGLDVLVDSTSIVTSVTPEEIEPRPGKQKHFKAIKIIGTAAIGSQTTTVLSVVGKTFTGVAEIPELGLDESDLPGLLHAMGELQPGPDELAAITEDMKPHQIKKAQKLRAAQQEVFSGTSDEILRALRKTITVGGDIPNSRALIPTLSGWRSW